MKTGIVDLSDDIEIENTRKKLDRKRFNEIKKYIPFLQYITAKDPVKNEKYVKLLQWFNSNKNLPARVATTCEFAINKRYKTLQSSMVFPPHIISIFEGGEEAIDLVSDDECLNANNKHMNNDKTENSSKKSIEVTTLEEVPSSSKKASRSIEKDNNLKPSTSSTKDGDNSCNQSVISIEEGDILDCENVVKDVQIGKKTRLVSLSEISLKEPPNNQTQRSAMRKDNDDAINQDLFNRIDNLDEDSVKHINTPESWKDFEKEDLIQRKPSPILKPKNLESLSQKSPDNFSNISDDDQDNELLAQRKKKKKHKHKKKNQTHLYDESETENFQLQKEKTHDEDHPDSPRRSKKISKKKKDKIKISRPLYVSDDEDNPPNVVNNALVALEPVEDVKIPECELFQRRNLPKKETITTKTSTDDSITVVLLDSDEDEIDNSVPEEIIETNIQGKLSPVFVPQPSLKVTNCGVSTTTLIDEKATSPTHILDKQKEVKLSSPNKMKNLNNMGLNELNDIYAKLCEKTGIQLEELLGDLVTKSSVPAEDHLATINEGNKMAYSRQTINCNNNDATEVCYESYNEQEEQFQEHHMLQTNQYQNQHQSQQHHQQQLHQQNNNYQQQQFQTHQQQQEHFQNQMHCSSNQIQSNPSASYPYQNSLMPRLNLNDPRIVLKLKQIKDSPIHNLSIRESATFLMNCHSQRPTYRSLPSVVKPTSNTATTYGEHKRLKELEKQQSEQAKQNKDKEKETNHLPIEVQESVSEAGSVSPQINSANKKLRKDSSGSENGEKQIKLRKMKEANTNNSLSCSAAIDQSKPKVNSKRKNSSESKTGRKTPESQNKEDTDEETVVMSFIGRPNSRPRIDSSSSSSTNDNTDLQNNTPSTDNTESNIRKVVKIVMSALNQSKDNLLVTPSKSRRNSARKSSDSTKNDSKSPKLLSNSLEEELNNVGESSVINRSRKIKTKRLRGKTSDQLNKTPTKPKPLQPKRSCRELENLNCTFKEYSDMFEKFLLPTNDGKRLCTATSSSTTKKPEFSSTDSLNGNTKKTVQNDDSTDCDFDPSREVVRPAKIGFRRKTFGAVETPPVGTNKTTGPIKVCFRRLSEREEYRVESIHDTESSDETDEFDIEEHRKIKSGLQNTFKNINTDPFNPFLRVTIQKLSTDEIMKWAKYQQVKPRSRVSSISSSTGKSIKSRASTENVNYDSIPGIGEMPILVPFTSKPVVTPKKTISKGPIHLNNNISMTLSSTKTCALCNKRPYDLTNHYVVQHQTESYTSRLSSKEIDNLEANITLAVRHRNRYKVTCAFCQVELEDNFVNFHAHFSFHTGEYGFKCAVCDLVKPYREDIRSHQYRTSACLNGKIRSNYLYSPDLVVIYLFVCNLCNFVQLNEANIHKHQRDHHGIRFEDPQNVKKCILAALDNGEILNEIMSADREEDEFTAAIEKGTQQLEQEFLDENPLDIKDVLVSDQEFPSTSQLASIENLLEDINVDNDALASIIVPSPEDGLKLLHSPPKETASNVMTVIHTSSENACQESHKPLMEPIDEKPELKAILPESSPEVRIVESKMIYRQMPTASNYFGMYKCTLVDCWFSSNEADRFVQHVSTVHNSTKGKFFLDCAYCQFKAARAQNIVGHVRAKHANCRYQCSECTYRSTIPGNVAIHRRMCHEKCNSEKGIYECASRVSQLNERLTGLQHKLTTHITSLKCPDCSEGFYAISSIKTHIQKAHPLSFNKLDPASFSELACLHCKEVSNNKENMRIHLALDHPDEIGYVAERKLKNKGCIDAVENLNMINISMPVPPADIYTALIEEGDSIVNTQKTDDQTLFEDAPPSKVAKSNPSEVNITEDVSLILPQCITPTVSLIPTVTLKEEEKCLRPLLELLTENTGPPSSSLYRCPGCVASFLHYELWQKHIITRHKIKNTVSCPYCSKQFPLELAELHFESHRRHVYICFHCVTSFCSREKIFQHFASFHPEFKSTIEKKIAFGDVSFSIFKEKIVSIGPVDWVPLFIKLSDGLRQQLKAKLQQNQHNEWLAGFSASCLAELGIPQYIMNGLPRYKCLVKSCPYVGSDEDALNVHMNIHSAPDKYSCSHCAITQTNPSWENIKDHKMLHKQELYLCCVCNFFHHSFAGMSKHIEQFHKIRDVPVISIWRDEINLRTSLSIVFPENKMSFSTADTCFCCLKVMKKKLVYHLKKEHKITLCPKCVICDAVILTHIDAEVHAREHKTKSFKLKYEILTSFLYRAVVTSTSPFTFETQLIKEKRPSQDSGASTSKKVKPNEDVSILIKKEIVVKTETEEITNETPSASIKCVNLQNLMQTQNSSSQLGVISVQPISALSMVNNQRNQYESESVGQCFIPISSVMQNNISQNIFLENVLISPMTTVLSNPQEISPILRLESTRLPFTEQSPQTACELNLPELAPICGNCKLECSDFAHLKSHFAAIHVRKNERFLFRVLRKVECMYCSFRCSLSYLSVHHKNTHPNVVRLCRSVIDSNRCGVCHEIFISPLANQLQIPTCACPRRQRFLADCLNSSSLAMLQSFGQNFSQYTCDICNTSYNREDTCREHIVKAHKKANYPRETTVKLMFVCFSCEKTDTSIEKIIKHIHETHVREVISNRVPSVYGKIKIIYQKGLTICAEDLKNTQYCHNVANFIKTVQDSEKKLIF